MNFICFMKELVMKQTILLILTAFVLISACGEKKSPAPLYSEGSNEFNFFNVKIIIS